MASSTSFPFSVITGQTVMRLIHEDIEGCMSVVSDCYLAHDEGRSVNPPSFFLRFPDRPNSRIIGLPTHLAQPWDLSGIKWIASYPDNIRKGYPRASAVLLLNSHENGYPFACLEASIISASRTAASAVLAAYHLGGGRRSARALGIVGTGLIARYVYRFLLGTGWDIGAVHLYDLVEGEAEKFKDTVCEHRRHEQVLVASDLPSLLATSDLILFTTTSAQPHVNDPQLFAHNPMVLHISLRDLAPRMLLHANNIVDDIDHVMHADTSPHLTEKLTGNRDFVNGTLADVIRGRCRLDRSRPSIFSPFGLGVLDLAVGKWIYDRAMATGECLSIQDFFCDLQR
jgi:2,3-diaminopropionate biosynthesis protein SbnB